MRSLNVSKNPADLTAYWEHLITGRAPDDVDEVGQTDMGREFNRTAYALRLAAITDALRRTHVVLPGLSVFEGAFGVGYYLRYWQTQRCGRVAGVELSSRAVDNVRRRFPNMDLRQGDLALIHQWSDWSELTGQFGLATAIDVIYHIVDTNAAQQALLNLSDLVQPGGVLLITDKFPTAVNSFREHRHVMRRSLNWYVNCLRERGLVLEQALPVFWCMDPPVFNSGQPLSAALGYVGWVGMRATLKYWPRNSRAQDIIGTCVGKAGAAIDQVALRFQRRSPNLTVAAFRKQ